jgi:hypothetical protein
MRRSESREWQLMLARAYRMLAEAEVEAAAQVNRQECSRTSILVGSPTAASASRPRCRRHEPNIRLALHPVKLLESFEQWRYPPSEDLPLAGQGTLYEFALRFWTSG